MNDMVPADDPNYISGLYDAVGIKIIPNEEENTQSPETEDDITHESQIYTFTLERMYGLTTE